MERQQKLHEAAPVMRGICCCYFSLSPVPAFIVFGYESLDFILKAFRFVNGSLNVPNMLWHLCSANLANAPIHPIARTHMHTHILSCMFPACFLYPLC